MTATTHLAPQPTTLADDAHCFTARERPILALILLCYCMVLLDSSIVFTAIPVMRDQLGLTAAQATWVQDAYTLTFGGALLLGAQIGEVVGRTRVFIIGIVLFGTSSLIVGAASTPGLLIAARAIQGLGASIVAPTSLTLMTAIFTDPHKRQRATSAYGTTAGVGASTGMLLGGIVTTFFSWRVGFLLNVPLALTALVLSVKYLPDLPKHPGRFDVMGAALSTTGLFILTFAFIEGTWWLTVPALSLLAVFLAWERRAAAPIVPSRLWKHVVRGPSLLGRFLFAAAMFGMFFFTSQYLELTLGYSALSAAMFFLINCIPQAVVGFQCNRVLGHCGLKRTVLVGLGVTACGLALIAAGMASTPVLIALGMIGTGAGQGLCFGPMTSLGVWDAPAADAGAASGLLNTMHQMGATMGVAALSITTTHLGAGFARPPRHRSDSHVCRRRTHRHGHPATLIALEHSDYFFTIAPFIHFRRRPSRNPGPFPHPESRHRPDSRAPMWRNASMSPSRYSLQH